MDLKTYIASQPRGAGSDLAAKIDAPRVLLTQWTVGDAPRAVPVDRCADIERATEGAVTCEEMRPDVRWHRVKDKAWPWHAKGRPLLEVAA